MSGINMCRRRKCCPTIRYKDGFYYVTDDYENEIKLDKKNLNDVCKMFELMTVGE